MNIYDARRAMAIQTQLIKHKPDGEVYLDARARIDKRQVQWCRYTKQDPFPRLTKPRVRVHKYRSATLYLLRVGDHVVAARSWRALMEKAAYGSWGLLRGYALHSQLWPDTKSEYTGILKSNWLTSPQKQESKP